MLDEVFLDGDQLYLLERLLELSRARGEFLTPHVVAVAERIPKDQVLVILDELVDVPKLIQRYEYTGSDDYLYDSFRLNEARAARILARYDLGYIEPGARSRPSALAD